MFLSTTKPCTSTCGTCSRYSSPALQELLKLPYLKMLITFVETYLSKTSKGICLLFWSSPCSKKITYKTNLTTSNTEYKYWKVPDGPVHVQGPSAIKTILYAKFSFPKPFPTSGMKRFRINFVASERNITLSHSRHYCIKV